MADLLLTVVGADFELTMQGSGNPEGAKAALQNVFAGYEVKVQVVEPVDMSGH
jgi:hypothetical protein